MSATYDTSPTPYDGPGTVRETRTVHTSDVLPATGRRVSWSAIFAGVVMVIAVQLLLGVLGAGIGLGMVRPMEGGVPDASSFGTGAGLWWLLSTVIALVAGSYVAARLAGLTTRFDGALHGLVIWGLSLLLTFYLLSSAVGSVIGGAFSVLGSTVSAVGETVRTAAPPLADAAGLTPEAIRDQAQRYLQPTNPDPATMSAEDAQKEVARLLPDLVRDGPQAEQAKQRIIDIMAAQMNIPRDEAARRFDEAQTRLQQTRDETVQDAKVAADRSAAAASTASYMAFAALLIGAIAAAVGGMLASPRRVLVTERRVV